MRRNYKKDKASMNLDSMIDVIAEDKSNGKMSLSACLNRIRIKIDFANYNDSIVEELKDDFNYVEEKMGICQEEACILAYVLENSSGWNTSNNRDIAPYMGLTNI
jgi:hypothetical protein